MKILFVEDDPKLAGLALKGLRARDFTVDHVENGDDGLTLATTRSYDALVLDIMLPGRDGLSILRQIRAQGLNVPVILVTARSGLDERLDGLNLGADDYLTKPFYVEELIARIHAVVRRVTGHQTNILQNGEVSVNLLTREVQSGTDKIGLTAREFALLVYLLRSPGKTFTSCLLYTSPSPRDRG